MFTIDLSSAKHVSHTDVYRAFTDNIAGHECLVVVTRTNEVSPTVTDRFGVLFRKHEGRTYKATAVWKRTESNETAPSAGEWIDVWEWEVENFGQERTGDPLTDKYLESLEPISFTIIEAHEQPGHYAYHWANQLQPVLNFVEDSANEVR